MIAALAHLRPRSCVFRELLWRKCEGFGPPAPEATNPPTAAHAVCAGACSQFVQYFRDHQDKYNAPDQEFRQLAYNAPAPSGACCAAANQFVGQKCSCDGPLLGNADRVRRTGWHLSLI